MKKRNESVAMRVGLWMSFVFGVWEQLLNGNINAGTTSKKFFATDFTDSHGSIMKKRNESVAMRVGPWLVLFLASRVSRYRGARICWLFGDF